MDSILMSCPTCGHSVSNASGACAYCGAIMTEDQAPPAEESGTAGSPQSDGESPPSTSAQTSDLAEVSALVDELPALSDVQSTAPGPEESAEHEPEAEAIPLETEPPTEVEDKRGLEASNSQLPSIEAEPERKAETEIVPLANEAEGESDLPLAIDPVAESLAGTEDLTVEEVAPEEPVAESEAQAGQLEPIESGLDEVRLESAVEEVQSTVPANSAETEVNEPEESDISGENIIELAEIQNIQEEFEKTSASETSPIPLTLVESGDTASSEPSQPISDAGIPIDAKAGLITESLDDTILLEIDDEVQPDAEKGSEKISDSTQAHFDEEALKIEKAAQDMAAAINKQKASMVEIQMKKKPDGAASNPEALNKPKPTLAKARAAKKQKMILAKAAALKRKKAAQAKALKKQEAAQAGNEKAQKNEIASAKTAASEKKWHAKSPDTSSKLRKLLERYKGRAVGINYDNSADIRAAQLVEANSEYFSVFIREKNLKYSYPLTAILTLIEGKDGVEAGESGKKSKFDAVIKVYPLVLF